MIFKRVDVTAGDGFYALVVNVGSRIRKGKAGHP
jgi:hypothetical protein